MPAPPRGAILRGRVGWGEFWGAVFTTRALHSCPAFEMARQSVNNLTSSFATKNFFVILKA
jgi:hypothetical protein